MRTIDNYPVVYAPMQIVDVRSGRYAYIVSKAYLVGNRFRYGSNKEVNYTYEVVFPYHQDLDSFYYQIPDLNIYDNYMNSDLVDDIFLDFEDCKNTVKELNCDKIEEFDTLDEYLASMNRIEAIESMINAETENLRLGRRFNLPALDDDGRFNFKSAVRKQLDNIYVPTKNSRVVLKKKLS